MCQLHVGWGLGLYWSEGCQTEPVQYINILFVVFRLVVVTIVIVSVSATTTRSLDTILSDGNLDTLQRKALAQLGAFNNTGEFLGGEDLEGFAEDRGQNGSGSMVDHGCPVAGFSGLGAHVNEAHFEAIEY